MKNFRCLRLGDSLLNKVTKNYPQGFDIDIKKQKQREPKKYIL